MYIAKLVKTELIQTRPAAYRKKFSFPTTKFLQNFSSIIIQSLLDNFMVHGNTKVFKRSEPCVASKKLSILNFKVFDPAIIIEFTLIEVYFKP